MGWVVRICGDMRTRKGRRRRDSSREGHTGEAPLQIFTEIGALVTEKQHSEHTGRARLLCILAMPPQARPHKTMAEAGKRKGPGGGTLGTSVPSNWCVFLLYGRPYPFARREIFSAFERDRSPYDRRRVPAVHGRDASAKGVRHGRGHLREAASLEYEGG